MSESVPDLERRVRMLMAEAEGAAEKALAVMSERLKNNGDKAETFDLQRLAQVARVHSARAEALREALEGEF